MKLRKKLRTMGKALKMEREEHRSSFIVYVTLRLLVIAVMIQMCIRDRFSPSDIQSIMKKAMVKRLQERYHTDWFTEEGASFPVRVFFMKDVATVGIDTSGISLHKRGDVYKRQGERHRIYSRYDRFG